MEGIYVRGLSLTGGKDKNRTVYIDNVSLSVDAGEVYCLLGIDKAKPALLRLIGGGHFGKSVYIENENILADVPITEDICYIAVAKNPWDFMTVYEYAKYMLSSFVLSQADLDALNESLGLAGLSKKTGTKLKYLTATEKKLLDVAVWLSKGRTKLVINADDLIFTPRQFNELNSALLNFKTAKKTVLISIKDARLVGGAVDRVGIFKQGKIVLSGDPKTVSTLLKKTCYTIRPTGNIKAIAENIKRIATSCEVKIKNDRILIFTDSDSLSPDILRAVSSSEEGLIKLTKKEPTLAQSIKKIN